MPQHIPGNHWDEKTKIETVKAYIALGTAPAASAVTGVKPELIRNWKMQQWWKDLEAELRSGEEIQLSARLKKFVNLSLEKLEDRLENGDWIYDQKSGKLMRKELPARELHRMTSDFIDKARVIDGKPTSRTESVHKIEDQLKLLAQRFAEFTGAKKSEVIDVEFTEVLDAIHEERKEGLREGVRMDQEDRRSEENCETSPSP